MLLCRPKYRWLALPIGATALIAAAALVLVVRAFAHALRASADPICSVQPPAVTSSLPVRAGSEPEIWSRVSAGLRGTFATLEAERSAAGFVRRKIAVLSRLSDSVEAIGWSGEGTVIVLVSARNGKIRAQVHDLSTGAEWTAPLDLPASNDGVSVAYTFLDETGSAPTLLLWYPWWVPQSVKVIWAARVDCAARRITALSEHGLEAVRRRSRIVAAPETREGDRHQAERLCTLRVISGDGKTLRTIRLPEMLAVEDTLTLPIPTFRGGLNQSCRTVAYGADPPSFLFNVYPDALILDPLLDDALSVTSPQMRIHPSDVVALSSNWPGKVARQRWSADTKLTGACVNVTGDCVALTRRTDTHFVLAETATAPLRVFDQGDMYLRELRIASPDYGVQLVDFTAQAERGWPAVPPPGQPPARAYWAEPPDTPRSQFIGIEWPSLSPLGKRIAYIKNGELWLAERPAVGGKPDR